MAGEIQIGGTTFATESGGTVTVSNVDSATNRTNLGLGSMATQNANAVAITGGTIENATLDSTNTFNFANDSISGDKIDGGTISNFTSTGIDDNASSTAITIAPSGAIMYSGGVYAATKRVTSFTLTGGGSTDTLFDLWSGDAGRGHYLISVTRAGANVGARSLVIVASSSSSVSSVYSVLDSTGITVGVSGSDVTASYSGAGITVNAIAIPLAIDGN